VVGHRGFAQGRWDLSLHGSHVAQLFSLGIVPHFMRVLHIIIGAALTAAFVIGCSKSSTETPTIRLTGYYDAAFKPVVGKASRAAFELKNPTESWVACAFHSPTAGHPDSVFTIKPNGTENVVVSVGQTNAEALSVTLTQLKVVSSRELSVPIQ